MLNKNSLIITTFAVATAAILSLTCQTKITMTGNRIVRTTYGKVKRDARKMKESNINNKTIRTDQKFSVRLAMVATVAILAIGSTKTTNAHARPIIRILGNEYT